MPVELRRPYPILRYLETVLFCLLVKKDKQPSAADPAVVVVPASCSPTLWFAVQCVGLLSLLFLFRFKPFYFYFFLRFFSIFKSESQIRNVLDLPYFGFGMYSCITKCIFICLKTQM